jgi:HEAT repeat protein
MDSNFNPDLFDFDYVDPLFSSPRRPTDAEIEEIIECFVNQDLSMAEAEAAFERLSKAQRRVMPRLLEMAASPDPRLYQTATVLLAEIGIEKAAKPLHRLLEDPTLEDEHKMSIMHALQVLGGIPDDEDPFVYLSNPEAMLRKSQEAILNLIQNPLQLETILQAILEGDMPGMTTPQALTAMAQGRDRRVLPLFLCLLHAPADDVVIAAIEALKALREPATIASLEERAVYDPSPVVRQAAREAAAHLGSAATAQPTSIFELPVAPPPLVSCRLSTIDGSGGQVLFIIRQTPDDIYEFLDLMFNDHQGIKDCFGGQAEDIDEVEDMVTDRLGEMGIELVDVSIEKARAEIERAYQTTLETMHRLPPSYMSWKLWLQGEDPEPVEVFPLPEVTPREQADLLARCDELIALEEFDSWAFNPADLQELQPKFERLANRKNASAAAIQKLIVQGIRKIVDDKYRQLLRERLERQAWLLTQLYGEEDIPKLALAAAAGLADGASTPPEEHPLLREMMLVSFANTLDDWELGEE